MTKEDVIATVAVNCWDQSLGYPAWYQLYISCIRLIPY